MLWNSEDGGENSWEGEGNDWQEGEGDGVGEERRGKERRWTDGGGLIVWLLEGSTSLQPCQEELRRCIRSSNFAPWTRLNRAKERPGYRQPPLSPPHRCAQQQRDPWLSSPLCSSLGGRHWPAPQSIPPHNHTLPHSWDPRWRSEGVEMRLHPRSKCWGRHVIRFVYVEMKVEIQNE